MSFSVDETAALLGCGPTMIHELIATGQLASFRIRTRRLISRKAIEQFITEREIKTIAGST